jgi:hypothetical protein
MDTIQVSDFAENIQGDSSSTEVVPAWELVEAGRYRPRRIRGSYRGRELG